MAPENTHRVPFEGRTPRWSTRYHNVEMEFENSFDKPARCASESSAVGRAAPAAAGPSRSARARGAEHPAAAVDVQVDERLGQAVLIGDRHMRTVASIRDNIMSPFVVSWITVCRRPALLRSARKTVTAIPTASAATSGTPRKEARAPNASASLSARIGPAASATTTPWARAQLRRQRIGTFGDF